MNFKYKRIYDFIQFHQKFKLIYFSKFFFDEYPFTRVS